MENKIILDRYLNKNGTVKNWPGKEKNRILVLSYLATKFCPLKKYTEQEVNLILMKYIDDYVTRRRDLIEYNFLNRTDDGKIYWVNTEA